MSGRLQKIFEVIDAGANRRLITGAIAAQEIDAALKRDEGPPSDNQIRRMARAIIFKTVTQQMPTLPRKVRRELARRYESERWNARDLGNRKVV